MAKSDFLADIVRDVTAKTAPTGMSTKVIAIDGPGGAGKSTLANGLAEELGGARIVRTNEFATWENPLNWWPRLIKDVLEPLARNQPARYRLSDWGEREHEAWGEVAPAEFVILEGVSASRAAFRPYLTYSIWIETPRELRLTRGLERDQSVRISKGLEPNPDEARAQWEQWMAEEDDYVTRENPHERADLVLRGDQNLWS